jgi:hypothetical protein
MSANVHLAFLMCFSNGFPFCQARNEQRLRKEGGNISNKKKKKSVTCLLLTRMAFLLWVAAAEGLATGGLFKESERQMRGEGGVAETGRVREEGEGDGTSGRWRVAAAAARAGSRTRRT